jgi:oxygen-dependent protoporphyrinogen oxidase
MPKVVIVGAGISGLALAYRLRQQVPPVDVAVLEQRPRPGGTIGTEYRDGFRVEIGPNGFLDSKPSTVHLCQELGLAKRLIPASEAAGRNRYLFLDGRLRPLPAGVGPFLTSDLLSWRGKVRFLAERFYPPKRTDGDESIADFTRRRAGNEARLFADALVTGIHAGDPALLSLPAAFPRLAALERQYGSVLKGFGQAARQRRREAAARGELPPRPGRMWSFAEGLGLLIETLCASLARPPVYGIVVRRIDRAAPIEGTPAWTVRGDGADSWPANAVVLTCPAYRQATLLADLDAELAERVGGIAYNRVAVIGLGYRRADVPGDLNGFGFIAPQRTRRDLLGVQWCSSIFPQRAPPGAVLLRAMCGGWHRAEVVGWDDDRLLAAVRQELRLAMGITAPPLMHTIIRWDRAIPQYHLGHLDRVAWIEDRLGRHPGLFLGGNAYHGVALNDCTEHGELLAMHIARYLRHSPRSPEARG